MRSISSNHLDSLFCCRFESAQRATLLLELTSDSCMICTKWQCRNVENSFNSEVLKDLELFYTKEDEPRFVASSKDPKLKLFLEELEPC